MSSPAEYRFFIAFFAGTATFISPCILPLIPAYISYITGVSAKELQTSDKSSARVIFLSFCFVAGFASVFTLLGASASIIGGFLTDRLEVIRFAGGAFIIIFGLHIAGVFRIKMLYREKRISPGKIVPGALGAFVLGVVFAAGWTPCVGPILASILLIAAAENTALRGMFMLAVYSAGIGLPFIITAAVLNKAPFFARKMQKHYRLTEILSGALLVIAGALIIAGKLQMPISF